MDSLIRMKIGFDNAFGVHERALLLHAKRAQLLAANLANADTPGYKARDIDFKAVLAGLTTPGGAGGLATTDPRHLAAGGPGAGQAEIKYREPLQPSIDGNTVDSQVEQAAFLRNALEYQASLTLLNGRIRGLHLALRGDA